MCEDKAVREAILNELTAGFTQIAEEQILRLAQAVRAARHILVQGKGRMGLILKAFAAQLAAQGYEARVVGDVTTPPIGKDDLLIVTPTGGDPKSSTRFLQVARENGALVAAFTANRAGPVGSLADLFVEAQARTMGLDNTAQSVQPMCSALEQMGLLMFDAVCALLAEPGLSVSEARAMVLRELSRALSAVREEQIEELIGRVDAAPRVFFDAPLRERLLLSCYAMRVHHMGKPVYVAGEVTAPEPARGDALVFSCGNGADETALFCMERARRRGVCVMALTSVPEASAVRERCDAAFYLPGMERGYGSEQQRGLLYGQCLLVALDYAVYKTMRKHGWREEDLSARHTNME